jgi:hypothetical protein
MASIKIEPSPQLFARIGGIAYLIIIIAGGYDEMFIRNAMIAGGDAAATARNIAASPLLWRISLAGDIVMHMCDLILAVVYYYLFKPVNKHLALLSLLFGLVQTAVLVANKMNLVMPLLLLNDAAYLKSFTPEQLQALIYTALKAHDYGFDIGLVFFGFSCLLDGYLIRKSLYLPAILGVLVQIAGLCYIVNSFSLILSPALANQLFPAILVPPLVGELSICLWLIFKGVNRIKWNERQLAIAS